MRVPPGADVDTTPNCRTSLRTAIIQSRARRRNFVQIFLVSFCLVGLVFNISATATTLTDKLATLNALAPGAWAVFLFFWLATQTVISLFGAGALARLATGRALSLREALDDILLHRR